MSYEVQRDPDNGMVTGVKRLSDGATIPKDPANPDWQAFLAWNAQQSPPLDLSDLPPPTPGDILTQLRNLAKQLLDDQGQLGKLLRAILLEQLEDRNTRIAQGHNDLLTWLGTQTALTNRTQLPGFVIITPNVTAVREAIKDRLDAGQADV